MRQARRAGLLNEIFLIVGHPAEGEAEFEETQRFLRRNRHWIDRVAMTNPCYALPDTDLSASLARKGVELPHEGWYGYGSWIDGDNHVVGRIRRMKALEEEVRRLGIPCGDEAIVPKPRGLRAAAQAFLSVLRRRP
ncbi:MAG: hypothetical protein NTW86_11115 [Candidatus Sumerlaeota bacterium]|nr:hypothetical protein [Candidatus Sumerlaeota bacterium]